MRRVSGVDYLTTLEELVDPARTAVMVIGMQNDNVSLQGGHAKAGTDISGATAIVPRIERLLYAARDIGVLVTYAETVMRDERGAGLMMGPSLYPYVDDAFVPEMIGGSWGARTIDELVPQAGDVVIRKTRGSAMTNSILEDVLRMRGVRSLILTGVPLEGCVLETAVDTVQHGTYAPVLRDCVSSFDAENRRLALAWMDTRFPVFDLDEVLGVWQRKR
jgi:nicotinamidase-related amidase